MSVHSTHTMRQPSLDAYDVHAERLGARAKMILECLRAHGDGTSYEVLAWLKTDGKLPSYAESNASAID